MQLKAEARQLLVESYVSLRRGDTAPGSRVAYRMTVRQLEALIRLSEAIARSHLDTQVPPHQNYELPLHLTYLPFAFWCIMWIKCDIRFNPNMSELQ